MGSGVSNATVAAAATKATAVATQFSHTAAVAAAQLQTATTAAAQTAASAASTLAHAAAEKAHEGKQVVVDAIKKDAFVAAARRGDAKVENDCIWASFFKTIHIRFLLFLLYSHTLESISVFITTSSFFSGPRQVFRRPHGGG